MTERLGEDEYLFYKDEEEENLMLISHLGSEEYSCTGSCYCEEEERRSSSVLHLPIRAVSVLVASVTSVLAYQKARGYFEEECLNKFGEEEECVNGIVRSSVESCDQLEEALKALKEKEESEKEKERERDEREIDVEDGDHAFYFYCRGDCIPRYFRNQELFIRASEYECDHLENIGGVTVDCTDIQKFSECYQKGVRAFQEKYMVEYCKLCSVMKEQFTLERPKSKKKVYLKNIHLCVGQTSDTKENPSVSCVDKSTDLRNQREKERRDKEEAEKNKFGKKPSDKWKYDWLISEDDGW